ncbi:hypothetical protein PFLL34_03507 [Pseudomonas fluorescens]|nr:hypothetical protein PFLL34_03507 [Pseudomonas fluorescens]CAH0168990.1 hypothetical protein SRABI110_01218 [Pseudomonas carnis]CAH0261561.1 hypothetical protein SRABI08_03366 [Pseudomonas carnis]CAH0326026.1 hypothetical protein SRABI111_06025 [Pseudomonas carnis]
MTTTNWSPEVCSSACSCWVSCSRTAGSIICALSTTRPVSAGKVSAAWATPTQANSHSARPIRNKRIDTSVQPYLNFTCGALSASALVASNVARIGKSLYITLCHRRPGKVRISVL